MCVFFRIWLLSQNKRRHRKNESYEEINVNTCVIQLQICCIRCNAWTYGVAVCLCCQVYISAERCSFLRDFKICCCAHSFNIFLVVLVESYSIFSLKFLNLIHHNYVIIFTQNELKLTGRDLNERETQTDRNEESDKVKGREWECKTYLKSKTDDQENT